MAMSVAGFELELGELNQLFVSGMGKRGQMAEAKKRLVAV